MQIEMSNDCVHMQIEMTDCARMQIDMNDCAWGGTQNCEAWRKVFAVSVVLVIIDALSMTVIVLAGKALEGSTRGILRRCALPLRFLWPRYLVTSVCEPTL